ncbi:DoxX family protein [Blastopirellula sp. J2-11]|uniref:DoxX family protein n=1 Tax=Blastopirellula sp. J2-11 TaxID=2943192 RepID=UPI0021C5F0A4|nr:DoxX family protein [Blastopirellula sp. J2-11]UUO05614.1 DoxX family protein [Blastopirellula sp. J2-11]
MTPSASRFLTVAALFVRVALAASFLSAVADRFGIWTQLGSGEVAWGNMDNFLAYTQMLLWYLPSSVVTIAGWTATILEIVIAAALLLGVAIRPTAIASGALLLVFAVSMTFGTGPEGPLSFSVWTAAAASLLLAAIDPQATGPGLRPS